MRIEEQVKADENMHINLPEVKKNKTKKNAQRI